ncbi:MAG TPA: ATP-dependent DNA ligase [Acidobacteriaceae bacterium]
MTLFLQIAELAEQMAGEASRLKKRAAIAAAIATVHAANPAADDAALFAMYLAGTPFPESNPRKLNAGGALLTKAVLAVSDASDAALSAAYRHHGDLGAAAFDLLAEQPEKPATLTLADVAEAFAGMAVARTTAIRAALVDNLLRRNTPLEAKYLLKLMLGDMRIGVKQSLVEEAIAAAASTPEAPVSPAQVRHAVMLEADLGGAVRRAFSGTLAEASMRLFHPLGFMLASPVNSPEEAVARFTTDARVPHPSQSHRDGRDANSPPVEDIKPTLSPIDAFLEDKYDGMRAQLHCGDPAQPGRVAIYSRNRDDVTDSFPELSEAFAHADPTIDGPMILDGEILGWDFALPDKTGVPRSSQPHRDERDPDPSDSPNSPHALPFAVLGQRIGRKRVSNEWRTRVPVVFMAFDVLYTAGELTLHLPLRERRNRLEAIAERLVDRTVSPLELAPYANSAQSHLFAPTDNLQPATVFPRLILSPARLVESAEDIDRAYAAARARSNEGVMIKAADSTYQPGRRGLAWVKLKRELATLDVVITGAEYGHGKRAGLLSDYTFAVRGPDFTANGGLLNVGKAYSGVTDAEIAELTEFLKAHTLEDQGHFRTVEPLVILEVAFNNIMRSTRHSSGFALRFPRILRLRPDKPLAEIDTLARVEEIYQSQVDKPGEV